MFEVISGKLHGIKVTKCKLDYHGSVTIDQDLLDKARIPMGVFVYIWNKNSGARLSTYTLPGERGSGELCLNGAAARLCQEGDEVIISLSEFLDKSTLKNREAMVLTFRHDNRVNTIDEVLAYQWDRDGKFKIVQKDEKVEQENMLLDNPSLYSLSS